MILREWGRHSCLPWHGVPKTPFFGLRPKADKNVRPTAFLQSGMNQFQNNGAESCRVIQSAPQSIAEPLVHSRRIVYCLIYNCSLRVLHGRCQVVLTGISF